MPRRARLLSRSPIATPRRPRRATNHPFGRSTILRARSPHLSPQNATGTNQTVPGFAAKSSKETMSGRSSTPTSFAMCECLCLCLCRDLRLSRSAFSVHTVPVRPPLPTYICVCALLLLRAVASLRAASCACGRAQFGPLFDAELHPSAETIANGQSSLWHSVGPRCPMACVALRPRFDFDRGSVWDTLCGARADSVISAV